MLTLSCEILSLEHLEQLTEFEFQNRAWFEQFIAPRSSDFYSVQGVEFHIRSYLSLMNTQQIVPIVIMLEKRIVGRGNIKQICPKNKQAHIGYRVAEHIKGKGVATFCLAHLIQIAKTKELQQLKAQVLDGNPASIAVLKKCGFGETNYLTHFSSIKGQPLGCTELIKAL